MNKPSTHTLSMLFSLIITISFCPMVLSSENKKEIHNNYFTCSICGDKRKYPGKCLACGNHGDAKETQKKIEPLAQEDKKESKDALGKIFGLSEDEIKILMVSRH